MSMPIHPRKRQRGQGMTEYIIIVALVAIAAIAVYQFFGKTVRAQTSAIANELAGKSGKNSIDEAGKAADEATKEGAAKKGLDAFSNDTAPAK